MTPDDTVTLWIRNLKSGDEEAARRLWDRYFRRLVGFASAKLAGSSKRVAGEEDVALSAFHSFCCGAEKGRFPELTDRDSLWPLLVVLTSRKASHQVRYERQLKRNRGLTLGEADLHDAEEEFARIDQVLSGEPTPALAAEMSEECDRLLGMLDDETKVIALDKLEGFTNVEIAARRCLALRSVERKLGLIRRVWEERHNEQ